MGEVPLYALTRLLEKLVGITEDAGLLETFLLGLCLRVVGPRPDLKTACPNLRTVDPDPRTERPDIRTVCSDPRTVCPNPRAECPNLRTVSRPWTGHGYSRSWLAEDAGLLETFLLGLCPDPSTVCPGPRTLCVPTSKPSVLISQL